MRISEIWSYPIKSCAGVPMSRATVGSRGIDYDRHWMLVDGDGRFVSQRQLPRMVLIRPEFTGDQLRVTAPGQSALGIPCVQPVGRTLSVRVWRDKCTAASVGEEADAWFSAFLGETVRLVFLPAGSRRPVDPAFGRHEDEVGFADGFPFLLIGRSSLADLASRMQADLSMQRFRPNLVVDGGAAYAEDGWRRIRIGDIEFRLAKPCSRCVITTLNPQTAEADLDTLGALAAFRKRNNRVFFGQNLIHDGPGELAVGDSLSILEADG